MQLCVHVTQQHGQNGFCTLYGTANTLFDKFVRYDNICVRKNVCTQPLANAWDDLCMHGCQYILNAQYRACLETLHG